MASSIVSYTFPPYFVLLPAQRRLLCDAAAVKLGGRAFDVLVSLVERRDRVVSKDELLELAWPKLIVEENNLQVQVASLRKVLGHPAIATIPGRGYRFTLPVTREQGEPTGHPAAEAPPGTRPLPVEPPVLFGRDQDLLQLVALMNECRLVTITGAAGIGKTCLAEAAAMRAKPSFDRCWWVDLAPLNDASRIADAVAVTLGISLTGSADAARAVASALQDTSSMLVLDNAEHVLDAAAAFVAQLRSGASRVRFLVTSQERLHVEDECVFRLEPLSLPAGDAPEHMSASGAVSLFVARAAAADRRFNLSPENQSLVAEICRRLEGIPLAIELAAARMPLLGSQGLRDMLDQRLHLLTAGRRKAPHRHQTLRAALEWSYQLLTADEQITLDRLAVFAGGFTLEAAQHVAGDDASIDQWDVLEHLGALVDKSLVVADGQPLPRYRQLETTRLFAMERLVERNEGVSARARHRDYVLSMVEDCQSALLTGDATGTMARLDLERENMLTALAWAPDPEDGRPGLRLAAATHFYWFLRAMPLRGFEVARAALNRPGAGEPTPERCGTLLMAGWLALFLGQLGDAATYLDEALPLARNLGDDRLLCQVLCKFGHVRQARGEGALALDLSREALILARRLGDCVELGEALMQGGQLYLLGHDVDPARALFEEALAVRLRIGNTSGAISTCVALSQVALGADDPVAARAHIEQSLGLLRSVSALTSGMHCIATVADFAACVDEAEFAVLLGSALESLSRQTAMTGMLEDAQAERLVRARETLDVETSERVRRAGMALSYESALQVAREFMDKGRATQGG